MLPYLKLQLAYAGLSLGMTGFVWWVAGKIVPRRPPLLRAIAYLLIGENPGGSKYNKAQSLGTPQIDWPQLQAMLENGV
jgi:hypothetical protein